MRAVRYSTSTARGGQGCSAGQDQPVSKENDDDETNVSPPRTDRDAVGARYVGKH
jgi:hypothetical protein